MEKKIFFIDFDGTLMRDDKTISDKNREALRNAVDQGHYIALATGRAVSSGRRVAKELGLTRPGLLPGSIQWAEPFTIFLQIVS